MVVVGTLPTLYSPTTLINGIFLPEAYHSIHEVRLRLRLFPKISPC
jgi:hypothetical protein